MSKNNSRSEKNKFEEMIDNILRVLNIEFDYILLKLVLLHLYFFKFWRTVAHLVIENDE